VLSGRVLCDKLITRPEEAVAKWGGGGFAPETNKLSGTYNHIFAAVNKPKVSASYSVTPTNNVIPILCLGIPVK